MQSTSLRIHHISRTIMFLRRELRVWVNLDVEFLTNFTISLMKAIDIRSESAVKLLAEFLDLDAPYIEGERHVNAEHFAHEVYSFVRSPYKDLFVYDNVVQYDVPVTIPPPPTDRRRRRWRSPSLSSERERHRRRRRSRSYSVPRSRSRSRDRRRDEQYSRERNAMELDVRERQRRPRSRSYSASRSRSPSQKRRLDEGSSMQLDVPNERGLPGEITSGPEVKGKGRARSPSEESLVSLGTVSSAPLITPPLSGGRETQSSGGSREQSSSDPILTNGRIRWRSPAPAVRSKEESSRPPVAVNPKPPPRVRHRSLFESVQAHLARPPTSDESRPTVASTSNETDHGYTYDIHFEREDTPPPSLLLRMSDAHTGRPLVPQNHHHQREADGPGIGGRRGGEAISPTTQDGSAQRGFVKEATPILEAATATASKSKSDASTSRQMRPRLSAPEIMALTRARHARLGLPIAVATPAPTAPAPARASTLPVSVNVADGLEQDGTGGANRENPGASTTTTTTMAPTSSNSGARAALLRRLEEEKTRAKLAVTGVPALGNANSNSNPAMPANAVVIVDTAAIEARLRRKAQLRVRLAAEKRRATMS
uniref:PWI domain-containing protein n=1 Tax=Mycena chlorophos TaxID=658473 RepID=A0ABQ0MDP2_MYCCL|nr:predicted protein [Mycena chlorophos]